MKSSIQQRMELLVFIIHFVKNSKQIFDGFCKVLFIFTAWNQKTVGVLPEIVQITKQKRKKIKRWITTSIYLIFGLYFIIDFLLFFVATPIFKTYLQEKVKKETQGLFSVDFENISIELASRRIALKKFELVSDSLVYQELIKTKKDIPALYNISCSSVELWRTSLYRLFFKNKLRLKQLKLIDLTVELRQLPVSGTDQGGSRDFVHEDLFPSLSPYISEFQIDEIKLVNGKFNLDLNKNIEKKTTHVGYVSINLYHFLLNQEEHRIRKRLFFADNLQINIDEYRINLSDKIHFIYAQDLNISTKNSKLTARNSGIAPLTKSGVLSEDMASNVYRFNAPFIEIDYFNIYDLYFNQDIQVGKVILKKPKIDIYNAVNKLPGKERGFTKSKEIDLSRLIAGKLNVINVDTFKIDNGSLNFYYSTSLKKPTYQANSISLGLSHFTLDDHSFNDQSKILYANDIDLRIDNFSTLLPDKLHLLNVASVELSTFDKIFNATGINIGADKSAGSLAEPMSIDIPFLKISGTDFNKLYHQRDFKAANLTIGNSDIKLSLNPGKIDNPGEARRNLISLIMADFLNRLSIANINIRESKFNINKRVNENQSVNYKGAAIVELKNFLLDQHTFSDVKGERNLLFSETFNLELMNYTQELNDGVHQISSGYIELSTRDSLITLNGFKVHKKDQSIASVPETSWIYDLNLVQVSIRGIDIHKVYADSILQAGSISVIHPEIKLEKRYLTWNPDIFQDSILIKPEMPPKRKKYSGTVKELLALYFKQINVKTLNVENADLLISDIDSTGKRDINMQARISARLDNFNLSPKDSLNRQFSYADNMSFKISDYFSKLFENKYQLKIREARFSSRDSSFHASLVRFFPLAAYENLAVKGSLFSFYAPQVSSRKTDFSGFLNENVINAGYLEILNPSIVVIRRKSGSAANINSGDSKPAKSFPFSKINFSGFHIENGVLGIIEKFGKSELMSLNSGFSLQTSDFMIDSASMNNPYDLIRSLKTLAVFENIRYLLPDSLHLVNLKRLEFNSERESVQADTLYYFPLLEVAPFQEKAGLKEMFINRFSLNDFKHADLILDKKLISGELNIVEPDLVVLTNGPDAKNPGDGLSKFDLYSILGKHFNAVDFRHISIEKAKLAISQLRSQEGGVKKFDRIFADIYGLKLDSLKENKNRFLYSDDVKISMEDYEYILPGNIYKVFFDKIGISTGDRTFFAQGINLYPLMDREDYMAQKKKAATLSYLKTENIVAREFDIAGFIEKRDIIARKVDLTGLQYHAFRNLQYPLDSIKKPALPIDYLLRYKNLVKIDSVNISNSYIGHEVLGQNAKEPGFIDFTKINATIYNLTNRLVPGKHDIKTTVTASGYLMDKSLISASFHFPIDAAYGDYYYGGALDTFDLKEINPLLENLYFVSVTNGTANSLDFNISANEDYAEGKLKILYDDLKIDLLSKKKSDTLQMEKRGLFTMVANSVIRNSNPRYKNGYEHEGRVYFERNIYKSPFNYWLRSIMSGVQATLGFKSKELKERLRIERITEKFLSRTSKKSERKDKKQEKIQKKQIEKEVKQEQRNRKKQDKRDKGNKKQDKPLAVLGGDPAHRKSLPY